MQKVPGKLIMAANAIGSAEDIPTRCLETLKTADLLVFEEDRGARAALKAAGIHRDYLKYSEHGQTSTIDAVSTALTQGHTVVYMSDQGCPGLADPGRDLVQLALDQGATITTIPGPSALTAAIAACPFNMGQFHFAGFPAREPDKRLRQLQRWKELEVPVVLMDTPYRLAALLGACQSVFGQEHRGTLALDISGEQECFITASLAGLTRHCENLAKLNFVLILDRSEMATRQRSPQSHAIDTRTSKKPTRHTPVRAPGNRNRRR